jgi:hypothetical protein
MELRHGSLSRHLPPHIAGELHTARFCKLEYPIAPPRPKPHDFATLNIWCTTESMRRPVGAERVARIIAPAIARWLEAQPVPAPSETQPALTAAATATATATAAMLSQPERERGRRPARPAHSVDGERLPGLGMSAKSQARNDEARS